MCNKIIDTLNKMDRGAANTLKYDATITELQRALKLQAFAGNSCKTILTNIKDF